MDPLPDLVNSLYAAIDAQQSEKIIYFANAIANMYEASCAVAMPIEISKLVSADIHTSAEVSNALTRVLRLALLHEDFPVIWSRFGKHLELALMSDIEALSALAVDVLFIAGFLKGHGAFIISLEQEIINPLLNILTGKNLAAAAKVSEGLKGLNSAEIAALGPKLLELYSRNVKPQDPVVQFRFLELFMGLSKSHTPEINVSDLFAAFITDIKALLCNSQDQLLQANAVLTVQNCMQCSADFSLLQQHGIIAILLSLFPRAEQHETFSASVACQVLDLFAHCAALNIINSEFLLSADITASLRHCVDSSDDLIIASAVYTIGALAQSVELVDTMRPLLPTIEDSLVHGVASVQISALHAIGLMYMNDCSENKTKQQFLMRLNTRLQGKLFHWLFERCLSNFDEQKRAAYFALKGVLTSSVGLILALDTSTIVSDLIKRESDTSLSGSNWKYSILEALYTTPSLHSILNQALQDQIRTYLGQGVVFVSRSAQVAFESEQ